MKKQLLRCIFFLLLMSASSLAFSQAATVSGTVKAKDDGLPIPGVSVVVKGTQTGTKTNSEGFYKITVPSDGVLIFSFIGYKTISVKPSGTTQNVELEISSGSLNEVVITSLGIKKEKRALGYSAQTVGGDDLVASGQTDALNSLNGKIAGAQITSSAGTPGAAVYIQLRGQNSITGNNQPLFVIDGIPVDNSSNVTSIGGYSGTAAQSTNRGTDINPEDIESVTVLKGPGAAALYGNLASNGAILITTKKGKAGATQIDFTSRISANSVNKLPKLQDQWVRGTNGGISNPTSSNRYSWGAKVDTLFWTGVPTGYDEHGNIVGKSSPLAKIPFKPYDNLNSFFQTASSFDNSVAVSGGTDKATYRASASNSYQNSIVPTEYFERTALAFSGSLQVSKSVKLITNLTYTSSDGNQPQTGSNLSGLMLGLTRTPISFDNSNGLSDPANNPLSYTLPLGQTNLSGGVQRDYRNSITYDNPYWSINNNPYTAVVGRLVGNVQLDYTIGGGFNLTYRLGTDNYEDNRHQYYEIGSGGAAGGAVLDDHLTYRSLNSDLILGFTKKFTDNIHLDAKIGNNFYGTKLDELLVYGTGLVAPGFNNIANASTISTAANQITPYRTVSEYYDLSLDFSSTLYLETTGRRDQTSTLPSGKNSFFYPSANLSFVFTELGALKHNSVLNFGKLRASISQVGSSPLPFQTKSAFTPTAFADGYTSGISYPANGLSGFSISSNLANPDLKPEQTTQVEFGTQLQFFQNRLGIDASVYYSKGVDLILNRAIASTAGQSTETVNSGSLENKGLELQLTGTPIKGKDFSWTTFINFAANRNKVLSLANGQTHLFLAGFGGGETESAAILGQPLGVLYSYGYTRVGNQIVISDQPGNGVGPYYPLSNTAKEVVTGNPNPKFKMSFGSTFTYMNLSLYTLIDWKYKGDIWDGTRAALAAIGTSDITNNRGASTVFPGLLGHFDANGNLVHYASDGTTEIAGAGPSNTHSVVYSQAWYQGDGGTFGNNDESFIEDGSYIKLREITLSYDFKNLLFGKSNSVIKHISLGVYGRNIIIWTPYKGVDPETSLTGSSGYLGLDYFNNPSVKTFGADLKVKF